MNLRNGFLFLSALLALFFMGRSAFANDCVIREWSLAHSINDMRPIGVSQKFSSKEVSQVFVLASLNCLTASDAVIVKFERDGKTVQEKSIVITPASNYRIWTSVAAVPGRYRITMEIKGELLNVDDFIVVP